MKNNTPVIPAASDSEVLKMNLSDASEVTVLRALRKELPGVPIMQCIYISRVLRLAYKAGVTRGRVVNNL